MIKQIMIVLIAIPCLIIMWIGISVMDENYDKHLNNVELEAISVCEDTEMEYVSHNKYFGFWKTLCFDNQTRQLNEIKFTFRDNGE